MRPYREKDEKGFIRPVLLTILVAASVILSILFIVSPDASSHKYSGEDNRLTPERHDVTVTGKDTFFGIMTRFNVPAPEVHAMVKEAKPLFNLSRLTSGTTLSVYKTKGIPDGLEYKLSDFEILVMKKEEERWSAKKVELPVEVKAARAAGEIENSLYGDALKAGVEPKLVMEFSDIFAWDMDFATDVRKGDSFNVLYEVIYVDGRPAGSGKILGATMTNEGKTYTAIYYQNKNGASGYYDLEGRSLTRTLLKSPLRYRRISSYFTNRRYHPILKRYRPHHGIDYAAPTGTPVEAAGSGRVTYAGWKRGYGNFVIIKHAGGYSTSYGHLSRIKKGLRPGAKVEQGSVIGNVGSTGISTGPHLHYEVRVNGRLINPLSIKALPRKTLQKQELQGFRLVKDGVVRKLSEVVVAGEDRGLKEGG